MKIRFRITTWKREIRTPSQVASGAAIAQEFADWHLEYRWRQAVAENLKRRAERALIAQEKAAAEYRRKLAMVYPFKRQAG